MKDSYCVQLSFFLEDERRVADAVIIQLIGGCSMLNEKTHTVGAAIISDNNASGQKVTENKYPKNLIFLKISIE